MFLLDYILSWFVTTHRLENPYELHIQGKKENKKERKEKE